MLVCTNPRKDKLDALLPVVDLVFEWLNGSYALKDKATQCLNSLVRITHSHATKFDQVITPGIVKRLITNAFHDDVYAF